MAKYAIAYDDEYENLDGAIEILDGGSGYLTKEGYGSFYAGGEELVFSTKEKAEKFLSAFLADMDSIGEAHHYYSCMGPCMLHVEGYEF